MRGTEGGVGLLSLGIILLVSLAACGTIAAPDQTRQGDSPSRPRANTWSLHYVGECAGREPEPIAVAHLDDKTLSFDAFTLRREDDEVYRGSANFTAPMPADGRDIPYTIAFALRPVDDNKLAGTETITEDGGHSLACPIELRHPATSHP